MFKSIPRDNRWLIIPALTGIVIFLLLMRHSHPPAHISELTTGEQVTDESGRFLANAGYNTDGLQPFVVFRTDDELIKQQIHHFGKNRMNHFIRNGFLRFIPSYYWQVLWIDTEDHEEISITLGSYRQPYGKTVFRTTHGPDGAIQEFIIDNDHESVLSPEATIIPDTIDFHAVQTGKPEPGTPYFQHLKNAIAGTVWSHQLMVVDSTYVTEQNGRQTGHIILTTEHEIFHHIPAVTVTMNSGGQLYGIAQDVGISGYENRNDEEHAGLIRIIFYIIGAMILLIIFFRRLFYRLIDLRTATLCAVVAIGLTLIHMIHIVLQGAVMEMIEYQIMQIFAIIMGLLLFSGFIGIMVFMLSGLGESLTRGVWPEKITTLTLIRYGYFDSKQIGRSVITGVLASMLILGITSIMYTLADHSYLNTLDEQFFYADSYWMPPWHLFIQSLFWMFLISAGLYAGFLSWLAMNKNNFVLLLLAGGMAFSLMSSFNLETPGSLLAIPFWVVPGLAVTWLYLRYDLLTLFLSVFLFKVVWITADGLVVNGSPDAPLAWSVLILMGLLLPVGYYLAEFGKEYKHVPELVPRYIREITREQRVERELEIAHQVHQSFLPTHLPSLKGLEIAANCQAAFDVGGDYYDVIQVDDHRMAFVIGDVSGKGIQAAFYMTMVKGIFQSLVKEIPEPVPLLGRMNRLFYANARRGSFISLCYGLLDTRDGTLLYARAGHNPGILIPANSSRPKILRSKGLALGLTSGRDFDDSLSEEKIQMSQGDTLVFYTDGFTEAVNPANEMYGDNRIQNELMDHHHLNSHQLLKHMNRTLSKFTSGLPISDDMTMVIVQFSA